MKRYGLKNFGEKPRMSWARRVAWALALSVFVFLAGVLVYTLIGISDNGGTLKRIGEESKRLNEESLRMQYRRP